MKTSFLSAAALCAAALALPAHANTITLDFEGLGVKQSVNGAEAIIEGVGDFYNGGLGADGSGPGVDFGVTFSDNALAIQDADVDPSLPFNSGNFGGEPTPDTVLFFLTGSAATISFASGFDTGFSFFYSSINFTGSIDVYSEVDATGTLLASLQLPTTPFNGAPDPTGQFSPFVPIGVSFDGIAKSIDFGGTINQIGFDNITFGSATPGDVGTVPGGTSVIPLPAGMPLMIGALALLGGLHRRKSLAAPARG
ncbi:VPLPA-CTERM sorting domain-containing protein [Tropicimonas sp. S265A]|uniref:VPLPA-CTERM sorting domain-containing protein n=1 Tax=Tropicimonas sp. S265A TaxID=3415134 RepID=UPI003C7A84AB